VSRAVEEQNRAQLKMWKFFLVLVLASLVVAKPRSLRSGRPDLDTEWARFKDQYQKEYAPEEEPSRRSAWEQNHDFMIAHNEAYEAGFESYQVGENKYNDMLNDEFVATMNGLSASPAKSGNPIFEVPDRELANEVDWRTKGYVTPVKDQKQCGSCWAFSATGSLEGAHFNATGKLVSLSEQNLVDCSAKEGNHGCGGGLPDLAFKYIKDNNGIDTEASYPYTAKDGKKCLFNATTVGANLTSWVDLPPGNENALMAALSTVGPISIGIDASKPGFQMYKKGVYYSILCSSKRLDHGVLAVGYGTMETIPGLKQDYWIVKNSWGESWGDKGYLKMAKGLHNMCGVASAASFPVVKPHPVPKTSTAKPKTTTKKL